MFEARAIDTTGQRDLAPMLLDDKGRLKIMPAAFYADTTQEERSMFCVRHGHYLLPTVELVEHLRGMIGRRSAIEIGAGNGVLAEALGIPATDSLQQQRPEIRAIYLAAQQTPVPYGPNVEHLDALSAIKKYRPEVVIGAWVTHKWRGDRQEAGGNADGIDEERVIDSTAAYIVIGNTYVHRDKSIWSRPHIKTHPGWLYSRALNGSADFVAEWSGRQPHATGARQG